MAEYLLEAALVMVEALCGRIVDGANVDNDVAAVEEGGITGSLQVLMLLGSLAAERTGVPAPVKEIV